MPKRTGKFACAARGILLAFRTQSNFRIHFLAAAAVLVLARFFNVSRLELLWLVAAIFMVFTAELINTALERLGDAVNSEYHPLLRDAKDVAAGAVLMTALFSLVVAFFILGKYI